MLHRVATDYGGCNDGSAGVKTAGVGGGGTGVDVSSIDGSDVGLRPGDVRRRHDVESSPTQMNCSFVEPDTVFIKSVHKWYAGDKRRLDINYRIIDDEWFVSSVVAVIKLELLLLGCLLGGGGSVIMCGEERRVRKVVS